MNTKVNFIRQFIYLTKPMMAGVLPCLFSASIFANPVIDNVAAGQVTIQQTPNSTVINQTSQKAILNWNSFNIGANESTHFQQPIGGVALNRINASQGASQIYGRLTATGQIILVNPAGIFFGPGSYVNVGGLIASTANIADQDFLNNYYHFSNSSEFNGAVVNQGTIIAAEHGLIALIGGAVSNEGLIQANMGHVVLASGNAATMTFAGNELISFAVDSGVNARAIDKDGRVLTSGVSHTGSIYANGGHVLITAKDAAGVLDHVINMNGLIETRSVDDGAHSGDGEIILWGDPNGGVVKVAGTLNASGAGTLNGGHIIVKGYDLVVEDGTSFNVSSELGNGGFIDTSGTHQLSLGSISINTSAPHGKAGTWLIDPADINITTVDANITGTSPFTATNTASTLNVATLIAALANGNVTVLTTNDGFAGSGNITVSSGITWATNNTLLLQAFNNIIINAPISGIYGSLNLSAVNAAASVTTGASGSIDVQNFNLLQGQWNQVGTLPAFNVRNNFQINSGTMPASTVKFIRATSGNGSPGTPYILSDIYGIQGIASNTTTMTQSFALGADVDATITSNWNSGLGYVPIGNNSTTFTGNFNGQNHTITNLFINRPTQAFIGLFGFFNGGTLQNLSLVNPYIAGDFLVAGFSGFSVGTFNNLKTLGGSITANANVAGIAARMISATVTNSYNSATITGGIYVGGITDIMGAIDVISNSYNTGTIHSTGGGNQYTGGIAGLIADNSGPGSQIINSYSSGLVYGLGNSGSIGGLVGANLQGGTIINSYWDTNTSQQATSSGGTGLTTAQMMQSANFSTWSFGGTAPIAGAATPGGTWLILNGSTRPILRNEWSTTISTTHQVELMNFALGANYTLANNIDFTSGMNNTAEVWGTNAGTPTGSGFSPVGNSSLSYTGAFNGQNYTIRNLYINRTATNNVGLFAQMSGSASISNLALTGVNITGASSVGGLVGAKNAGTVSNVSVAGNITGSGDYIGGLTGYNVGDITGNTFVMGNVTATGTGSNIGGLVGQNFGNITATTVGDIYYGGGTVNASGAGGSLVGGLIGWNRGGVTTNVFTANTATVTALSQAYVGGLIGQNDTSVVNSYSAATVNGGTYVTGGLIGFNYGSISGNTYATGNVSGTQFVGGLMGVNQGANITPATIGQIYATGNVSGTSEVGGLIGENYRVLSNVSYVNHTGGVFAPSASYVGGLVGLTFGASISNSFADTTGTAVVGDSQVGGLIGGNASALSGNSYATGDVIGSGTDIGGLIGYNASSVTGTAIQPVYAIGSVFGSTNVGGLIGHNDTGNIITNVTANSTVTGNTNVGGLIGLNAGTLTASAFGITTVSGSVTGASNIGAFTGAQTTNGSVSNASIGNLTLQGLTGYNLFVIPTNTIIGTLAIIGPGSGNNTLDLSGFSDPGMYITLSGINAGSISLSGQAGNLTFSSIQNIISSSGDDTFRLQGGTLTGNVDAGAGNNTLIGDNVTNTWTINAVNGGTLTGLSGSFSNFQNLTGGSAVDNFNFLPGFSIAGLVDGGDVVNRNTIRFDTYADRLNLYLTSPMIGNIFDAGNVYTTGNALIAKFTRVQQSDGNQLGYVYLPNKAGISVAYYDATYRNGEIADPFYFNGWNVGNPPVTITSTPSTQPTPSSTSPYIAPIVNQPVTNAYNNYNYDPTVVAYLPPIVINNTYTEPLLDKTKLNSGGTCYVPRG